MKKCSTSLVIREMQIEAPVRYHFTSTTITVIKKTITSVDKDVKELELRYCWQECTMVQLLWKTIWQFLKKLNRELHMIQ